MDAPARTQRSNPSGRTSESPANRGTVSPGARSEAAGSICAGRLTTAVATITATTAAAATSLRADINASLALGQMHNFLHPEPHEATPVGCAGGPGDFGMVASAPAAGRR